MPARTMDAGQRGLQAEIEQLTNAELIDQAEAVVEIEGIWHPISSRIRYLLAELAHRLAEPA